MAIRVAVVGTGAIARDQHLPGLRALGDRVEVVAVTDLDRASATSAAAEFGVPAVYPDLASLLAAEHPDLVTLATPPHAHHDDAIAALDAGAWVLSEKPPALSLAQYDDIASHERPGGPYVSYIFQHRFGPSAQHLRDLVAAGTLGRPLVAQCHTLWYRDPSYFAAPWRGRWDTEGGGPTFGHGIHQLDLLLSILGDWTHVTAQMATLERDTDTEDVSLAIVRFASGALCSVTNSLLSPRQTSQIRIDFERASLELEHLYCYDARSWAFTPAPGSGPEVERAWCPPSGFPSQTHAPQIRAVIEAMEAGVRPPLSGEDGRRAMELVTGIYRSALTGRTVARNDLGPGDPFYSSMAGADPAAATAAIHAGTIQQAQG